MSSKIAPCTCSNEYQDDKYGKQQRVFNKTAKVVANVPVYRCTVCLKEKPIR